MTGRPPATERLVDAYLHDLDRALAHVDVDERRDVVDSVREHIEAALDDHGPTTTASDVEEVLRQLGSVEHIAHSVDDRASNTSDHTRNPPGAGDRGRAGQYLLAALIVGMAITGSLLTMRIPPFFGPEGGDLVAAVQLAWIFIVFAVAAFIVKRKTLP